jgi:hypothetical protein
MDCWLHIRLLSPFNHYRLVLTVASTCVQELEGDVEVRSREEETARYENGLLRAQVEQRQIQRYY